ncbi:DDE superfamily endonuclease [Mesorhizobium loti]|uniref:DDE superfamily endonuclease n=1 Tax=Rhizobium loti TaxID=381 RepID=A0A8E2W883_RHILI|nr:DDE superfamily endonuclease [Mesorhizobium loti]
MFKGRQFDQSVILLCVRWYLAYNVSLRDLEEMMAERGITVDHTTIHRWAVRFSLLLLERFNRRKRAVTGKWHVDETYIKVRGQWTYLYRAIDTVGDTVEFWFSEQRDLPAASASSERRLSVMADRIASSSTGARPTTRRSFPATSHIACRIAPGAG